MWADLSWSGLMWAALEISWRGLVVRSWGSPVWPVDANECTGCMNESCRVRFPAACACIMRGRIRPCNLGYLALGSCKNRWTVLHSGGLGLDSLQPVHVFRWAWKVMKIAGLFANSFTKCSIFWVLEGSEAGYIGQMHGIDFPAICRFFPRQISRHLPRAPCGLLEGLFEAL